MSYIKTDTEKFELNPFEEIGRNWTLITAEKGGKVNTMTASWGGIGVLWGKDVITVYVRESRYTREFIDSSDYFTVTYFSRHKKELSILGSESGRDCDKIAKVGFHIEHIDGQPTFSEGKLTIICRKLYHGKIQKNDFTDKSIPEECYKDNDYHHVYIGEIEGIYVNK